MILNASSLLIANQSKFQFVKKNTFKEKTVIKNIENSLKYYKSNLKAKQKEISITW